MRKVDHESKYKAFNFESDRQRYKFLILIRLLGSCKKIIGCSSLTYEKHPTSINEIVSFLDKSASEHGSTFSPHNILVVVNGIDSSILDANESLVQDGDIVTVVPMIHGG